VDGVIFHPDARGELFEASNYYESCRTELGQEFLAAVEAVVALVRQHPESGRVLRMPFKRLLVRRFPYGIIYSVTDTTVYIVAVMHLKRKPGYWLERIKDHR
jgi:toxin ParE1/3/4